RLGSTGKRVKELQSLLGIRTDGNFGPITEKHVRKFQSEKNLKVDGIVGPKTLQLLMQTYMGEIIPIYENSFDMEDQSDPEDEMLLDPGDEDVPTSKCLLELINLIETSDITRNVNKLVFHCTATRAGASISSILNYWKNNLKWKNPGYHILIKKDGSWTQILDFNQISNGVNGINSHSIHASYIGGIDYLHKAKDTRTVKQKEVLKVIYETFARKLPHITFHGHNEFSNKDCPCFNVPQWKDSLTNERDLVLT
ncbi:MAG TPA: peptidoglycan-binding protein, partial [Anditalea sp.]|nr:peptidoglycan-binding protein [Anditalea sp.]